MVGKQFEPTPIMGEGNDISKNKIYIDKKTYNPDLTKFVGTQLLLYLAIEFNLLIYAGRFPADSSGS